jgi:hypothetical protein
MYLYAIIDTENCVVKIGRSVDPEGRCAQLQTGSASCLSVLHRVRVAEDRAAILERRLHRELAHLRCRGEWFRISPERARGMLDYCVIRWHDDPLVE